MLTLKQFLPPYKALYNSPSFCSVHNFFSLSVKIRTKTDLHTHTTLSRRTTIPLFPFLCFCHKGKRGNLSTLLRAVHQHYEKTHVDSRSRTWTLSFQDISQERKRFQHQDHFSPNQNLSSTTVPQLHHLQDTMSSTHLQYTRTTTFSCYHTYPPAVLPNGVSSNRPPATLPYDCLDCMERHARNREDAICRQYRGHIEAVQLRIENYRQARSLIGRRIYQEMVDRKKELEKDQEDDIKACWAELYWRYGP